MSKNGIPGLMAVALMAALTTASGAHGPTPRDDGASPISRVQPRAPSTAWLKHRSDAARVSGYTVSTD